MASERFYIDARNGCIAVVDREHPAYDPEYNGLHDDTNGVLWYEHGEQVSPGCCGECKRDLPKQWRLKEGAKERAAKAKAELEARPPVWRPVAVTQYYDARVDVNDAEVADGEN